MTLLRSLFLALALLARRPAAARARPAIPTGSIAAATSPAIRPGASAPCPTACAMRCGATPCRPARSRSASGSTPARSTRRTNERGWAHFVEHMLFRGTESYPDRRGARRSGSSSARASAATPTPAPTPTETVYSSNLPHADRAPLDTSLAVLAEMMARARFEPAAVDAERPVVLAEKGRRPELSAAHHRDQPRALLCRPALSPTATRSAPTRR